MRSVRISRVVAVREERVGWRGRVGRGCEGGESLHHCHRRIIKKNIGFVVGLRSGAWGILRGLCYNVRLMIR